MPRFHAPMVFWGSCENHTVDAIRRVPSKREFVAAQRFSPSALANAKLGNKNQEMNEQIGKTSPRDAN